MALSITAFLSPVDEASLICFVTKQGFVVSPNQVPKGTSYVRLFDSLPMENWPEGEKIICSIPQYCIFPSNWDKRLYRIQEKNYDVLAFDKSEVIWVHRMRVWNDTMIFGAFQWARGRDREELAGLWKEIKTWLRRNTIKLKRGVWLAQDAQRVAARCQYRLMGSELIYTVKETEQGCIIREHPLTSKD